MENLKLYGITDLGQEIGTHYSPGRDEFDAITRFRKANRDYIKHVESMEVRAQEVQVPGFKITVEPLEQKVSEPVSK